VDAQAERKVNVQYVHSQPAPHRQGAPRGRLFQLQAANLLEHPEELLKFLSNPWFNDLGRRIKRGQHDCALCQTTLTLDPDSHASPGTIGFANGDFGPDVPVVIVAACTACTLKHGHDTVRAIGQELADDVFGGGTVQLVEGGSA
jgi:hypothetical protein